MLGNSTLLSRVVFSQWEYWWQAIQLENTGGKRAIQASEAAGTLSRWFKPKFPASLNPPPTNPSTNTAKYKYKIHLYSYVYCWQPIWNSMIWQPTADQYDALQKKRSNSMERMIILCIKTKLQEIQQGVTSLMQWVPFLWSVTGPFASLSNEYS